MARPAKEGLDYFPLDVGIFEDEKIEAIAGEFGVKGELAVIKLLCAIYKKGYFILWNDLSQATLLKRLPGVSKEMINQIVNRLVLWEFFDKELFDSAEVLTSENIQATFFEATKRRKTPKPTKYIINVNNNSQKEEVNVNINTQSKVKESKVKESKGNKNDKEGEVDIVFPAEFIQAKWGQLPSGALQENLAVWLQQFPRDLIVKALEIAYENSVNMFKLNNYVKAVLTRWEQNGIKTLVDYEQYEKHYQEQKNMSRQQANMKKSIQKEKVPEWSNNPVKESKVDEQKAKAFLQRIEEFRKERGVENEQT